MKACRYLYLVVVRHFQQTQTPSVEAALVERVALAWELWSFRAHWRNGTRSMVCYSGVQVGRRVAVIHADEIGTQAASVSRVQM